jgi:hypothetical protein
MGKPSPHRLLVQEIEKTGPIESIERTRAVQIISHRQGRALKVAGILLHIGVGNRERRVDDRLGSDLEPSVEPDIQRYGGDDRHHDCGDGGHQREHGHDAHMQTGSRLADASRQQNAMNLAADERHQHQNEKGVRRDENKRDGAVRRDGRGANENREGCACRKKGAQYRQNARQGEQTPAFLRAASGQSHLTGAENLSRHSAL